MNNYANNLDIDRALTEAYAYAAPAEAEIDVNRLPDFREFYADVIDRPGETIEKAELSPEEWTLSGAAIERSSRVDRHEIPKVDSEKAANYVLHIGALVAHHRKSANINRNDLKLSA